MVRERTREAELEAMVRRVLRDLGGTVGEDTVVSTVRSEYEALSATSRVPSFVPVLAERRARRRLRAMAS